MTLAPSLGVASTGQEGPGAVFAFESPRAADLGVVTQFETGGVVKEGDAALDAVAAAPVVTGIADEHEAGGARDVHRPSDLRSAERDSGRTLGVDAAGDARVRDGDVAPGRDPDRPA